MLTAMLRLITLLALLAMPSLHACYVGTLLFSIENGENGGDLGAHTQFTIIGSQLPVPEEVVEAEGEQSSEEFEEAAMKLDPLRIPFSVEQSVFENPDNASLFGE